VADVLRYAWHDGAQWQFETVPGTEGASSFTSMVLDAGDRPRIAYRRYEGGDNHSLMFAWHDGSQWFTHTVHAEGWVGGISLALTDDGWPRIAYHDEQASDLRYAWMTPSTSPLLQKTARPGSGVANSDTVTFTLVVSAPWLNAQLSDPLPEGLLLEAESITGTLEPLPAYSAGEHALSWEGILPPGPAQVRFRATVSGTLPLANVAWLTDTTSGLAVPAVAVLNPEQVYLPLLSRAW
jgi:hypothetical protein